MLFSTTTTKFQYIYKITYGLYKGMEYIERNNVNSLKILK